MNRWLVFVLLLNPRRCVFANIKLAGRFVARQEKSGYSRQRPGDCFSQVTAHSSFDISQGSGNDHGTRVVAGVPRQASHVRIAFGRAQAVDEGMSSNLRKSKRRTIAVAGMIYGLQGKPLGPVSVRNISTGGAQIEMATEIELPAVFILSLSRSGNVRRTCRKAWQFATVAGVSFYPRKLN
jgi:hypothetical protein